MRVSSKTAFIVASGILSVMVVPSAQAAITFLDHFNSISSFDIAPANGDYAGGDSTATLSNAPTTGTGFFPGSTPANLAFKAGGTSPSYVEFNGTDGNVDYTSATTGGLTVGAWVKFSGAANPVGRILTIGAPDLDDDYVFLDYGNANTDILRARFRDGGTTDTVTSPAAVNMSDWVYVAVTADLTNSVTKLYMYNSAGTALPGSPQSVSTTVTNWNLNNPLAVGHRVRIGGPAAPGSLLWMDELSIDDEVLSESAISARVASMVAGEQLQIPEPATAGVMALCSSLLLARRRRACEL